MYRHTLALLACLALASAETCSNGFKLVPATFDDINSPNNNIKPKLGYAGLKWLNGVVEGRPQAYQIQNGMQTTPFNNTTPPNVLRAGATSPSVTISTTDGSVGNIDPFALDSFGAACYSYISDIELRPARCTILVTLGVEFEGYTTQVYQYNQGDISKPTFVTFNGPARRVRAMTFQIVGRPVGKYALAQNTVLVLDNIVTKQTCSS